jgi:hypothetical protein
VRPAAGPVPCPVMTGDGFVPATFDPPTSLVTRRVPPRAVGAAAQPRRSCRLDIEHRAHPLHTRLPRRQLAATGRLDARGDLADLRRHAEVFTRHAGFTFTVLNPVDNDVIGCTYLYPSASTAWDVTVQYWVRADRANLDGPLADAVARWGSPPTGTGSGSTAAVADHHACSADATIEHVDGAEKAHRSRRCPRRESAESAATWGWRP